MITIDHHKSIWVELLARSLCCCPSPCLPSSPFFFSLLSVFSSQWM